MATTGWEAGWALRDELDVVARKTSILTPTGNWNPFVQPAAYT